MLCGWNDLQIGNVPKVTDTVLRGVAGFQSFGQGALAIFNLPVVTFVLLDGRGVQISHIGGSL